MLFRSGLKVSALTLGSMMFGEQTNTEDSLRIIDKAWDQGINFIDTADVYTGGRSEEIVGEAIARQRQDWVLASKVGIGPADGLPNRSGLSRKRIFNALEASLTRFIGDAVPGQCPAPHDLAVITEVVAADLDFLQHLALAKVPRVVRPTLAHIAQRVVL